MIYKARQDYSAETNSIIDVLDLSDYEQSNLLKNAFINVGGWQSWNPGFEILPGKKQNALKCHVIKQWNCYLTFPNSSGKPSKNIVLGQFVTYLRWNEHYLVFASVGNINKILPPVQFIFNRKRNTVSIELCDKGTEWKANDLQAEIEIFTGETFFEIKEKLSSLFGNKHFFCIENLGKNPGGWESWYNHYTEINETLIENDLSALVRTENIISKGNYSSKIFQIDDGWEENLGDWNCRMDRFPNGIKAVSEKIQSKNMIPGLWIAPFIIDSRSNTAKKNKDWLLKDECGKLVPAGYNPLWGEKGTFYCLDLDNQEVLTYLDKLFDEIINKLEIRYLKLDFLYAGMLYGKHKNSIPSYKLYVHALKIITSRKFNQKGQEIFYLGCGVPFELSFNSLPLSRIGCDTYEKWENKISKIINWNGRNSAYLNIKDTLGHALWNKTIFLNDPDVVFVRTDNCELSEKEKILIAKTNLLFGSQFMYSDDPDNCSSSEEIKITNEILSFKEKMKDEEFGVTQISKDKYKIYSKSGKYTGFIDIGKNREFLLTE